MLVYVCCATGNTSGMFCKQIQKASCREQIYVEEIHELGNHLEDALRENDLVLAYGSAEIIDEKIHSPLSLRISHAGHLACTADALLKGFHEKEAELL